VLKLQLHHLLTDELLTGLHTSKGEDNLKYHNQPQNQGQPQNSMILIEVREFENMLKNGFVSLQTKCYSIPEILVAFRH